MHDARPQPTGGTCALDAHCLASPELSGMGGMEGGGVCRPDAAQVGMVTGRAECRVGKLSGYTLRGIETEAGNAARDNRKPVEACSYAWGSREAQHWLACYLLAGGAI